MSQKLSKVNSSIAELGKSLLTPAQAAKGTCLPESPLGLDELPYPSLLGITFKKTSCRTVLPTYTHTSPFYQQVINKCFLFTAFRGLPTPACPVKNQLPGTLWYGSAVTLGETQTNISILIKTSVTKGATEGKYLQ